MKPPDKVALDLKVTILKAGVQTAKNFERYRLLQGLAPNPNNQQFINERELEIKKLTGAK